MSKKQGSYVRNKKEIERARLLGLTNKGLTGSKNHNWKGGRLKHSRGYILLYKPDHPHTTIKAYVFEHRFVMEQQLGRLLTPEERIHHIDGDKTNNKPENLYLYSNISNHQLGHCSMEDVIYKLYKLGIVKFNKLIGKYEI